MIDFDTWKVIKQIPTLGPGFFLRSHANSRYAWTDVFFGPDNDAIHLIDKQTLKSPTPCGRCPAKPPPTSSSLAMAATCC